MTYAAKETTYAAEISECSHIKLRISRHAPLPPSRV